MIGHEIYLFFLPRSRKAGDSFPCFHGVIFPISFTGFLSISRHLAIFKYLIGNFHHDQIFSKSVLASLFLLVCFLQFPLIHSVQVWPVSEIGASLFSILYKYTYIERCIYIHSCIFHTGGFWIFSSCVSLNFPSLYLTNVGSMLKNQKLFVQFRLFFYWYMVIRS